MPQHVPPRIYRRVPFESAVRLKFDRFHGFVEQYCANLSLGGMFVHSAEPPPLGTEVAVEFQLEDGFELIRGRGRVTWVREPGGDDEPGFGLRFLELTPGSRELIFRLVERRVREGDRIFDLEEAAPATAAGRLVHGEEHALQLEDRGAAPPWDRPAARPAEPAAAGGTVATAAAGGEVGRYGRAAREAAEAEPEHVTPGEAEPERAARGESLHAEMAPEAVGRGEKAGGEAAREAAAPGDRASGGPAPEDAGRGGRASLHSPPEDVAPARRVPGEAVPHRLTVVPAAPAETPRHPASPNILAPAAAASAGDEAPLSLAADGARAAAARGDDPEVSFAGLVDDEGATPDGAAASPGDEWTAAGAATAGDPPDASASAGAVPAPAATGEPAGGAAAAGPLAGEVEEAWPPSPWRQEAAAAPAGSGTGTAERAADSPADAAAEPQGEDAARWPWLVAEASVGAGEALAPAGGESGTAGASEPLAGVESSRRPARRRGARVAAAIAAGLAALAFAGFLLVRTRDAGAPAAGTAEAALATPAAVPASEDGAGATPADADPAEPEAAAPASGGADAARPDAGSATSAEPAAAGPGTIERIAWQRRDGGVDFEISGGGPIASDQVDHFRVGGERPRLVVRIAGVERPYSRGDLAVGGPLVERVRTGFHPAAAGAAGSLHVVFDLAAPSAAAAVDTAGGRVRVRFEER